MRVFEASDILPLRLAIVFSSIEVNGQATHSIRLLETTSDVSSIDFNIERGGIFFFG